MCAALWPWTSGSMARSALPHSGMRASTTRLRFLSRRRRRFGGSSTSRTPESPSRTRKCQDYRRRCVLLGNLRVLYPDVKFEFKQGRLAGTYYGHTAEDGKSCYLSTDKPKP